MRVSKIFIVLSLLCYIKSLGLKTGFYLIIFSVRLIFLQMIIDKVRARETCRIKTKSKQKRTQVIYSELAIARESITIICILAELQRQEGEWECFIVEKRGNFRYSIIRGYLLGESGSRLTRQNILCDRFGKHIYFPLARYWKRGQKIGNLRVLHLVLTIQSRLLQRFGLVHWAGCWRHHRSEFLLHLIWVLSFVYSIS